MSRKAKLIIPLQVNPEILTLDVMPLEGCRIPYMVPYRRAERPRPSIKTPAPRTSRSQERFELILIQPTCPNAPLRPSHN